MLLKLKINKIFFELFIPLLRDGSGFILNVYTGKGVFSCGCLTQVRLRASGAAAVLLPVRQAASGLTELKTRSRQHATSPAQRDSTDSVSDSTCE